MIKKWPCIVFLLFLLASLFVSPIHAQEDDEEEDPWIEIYLNKEILMMFMGIGGFLMWIASPVSLVYYAKNDDLENAFTYGLMFFVIGMALVIGWLWG
ncbi:MAG: hypothetical protein OEZ38_03380 [Gammaproteobacteria bacterium]|nr:hypothetical protein [Gammaproteobacteria bacterium]